MELPMELRMQPPTEPPVEEHRPKGHPTSARGLFVRPGAVEGPVLAEVILTHGHGEHSGRYAHVCEAFRRHGLRVWGYDLYGHGRSEGPRGDIPGYGRYLEDLDAMVGTARSSGHPVFLMGHSMGGQITINYLLARGMRHREACRGVVVTSPYLRLAFQPAWWRLVLAFGARWLVPSHTQTAPSETGSLSRDQEHLGRLPELELNHHQISARLYHALECGGKRALAGAPQLQTALLLIHGECDSVTSPGASQEFFERAGAVDKTIRMCPGMRHETHNEVGREGVLKEIIEWIAKRAKQG